MRNVLQMVSEFYRRTNLKRSHGRLADQLEKSVRIIMFLLLECFHCALI